MNTTDSRFGHLSTAQKMLRIEKTDDELREFGWKLCTTCKEMRPEELFYKAKTRNGLSYTCRPCHRSKIKGYRNVIGSYNFYYRRIENLRMRARKRGLPFELTVEDYKDIKGADECYYCGTPTDIITLDRKDNALGYTVDNVIGACFYCNRLKSDMFDEYEMKIIGKAVRHKHARDNKKNAEALAEVV